MVTCRHKFDHKQGRAFKELRALHPLPMAHGHWQEDNSCGEETESRCKKVLKLMHAPDDDLCCGAGTECIAQGLQSCHALADHLHSTPKVCMFWCTVLIARAQ